jgi:hypothetical protein
VAHSPCAILVWLRRIEGQAAYASIRTFQVCPKDLRAPCSRLEVRKTERTAQAQESPKATTATVPHIEMARVKSADKTPPLERTRHR